MVRNEEEDENDVKDGKHSWKTKRVSGWSKVIFENVARISETRLGQALTAYN